MTCPKAGIGQFSKLMFHRYYYSICQLFKLFYKSHKMPANHYLHFEYSYTKRLIQCSPCDLFVFLLMFFICKQLLPFKSEVLHTKDIEINMMCSQVINFQPVLDSITATVISAYKYHSQSWPINRKKTAFM